MEIRKRVLRRSTAACVCACVRVGSCVCHSANKALGISPTARITWYPLHSPLSNYQARAQWPWVLLANHDACYHVNHGVHWASNLSLVWFRFTLLHYWVGFIHSCLLYSYSCLLIGQRPCVLTSAWVEPERHRAGSTICQLQSIHHIYRQPACTITSGR